MTAAEKRKKATETFNELKGKSRFNLVEIEKSLKQVNDFLTKELKYSKDLRDVKFLECYFLERQYYKKLVSLF